MCLIIFRWQPNAKERLTLIANRDEFYHRPTQNLHKWDNPKGIVAGKDKQAGGTWMGFHGSQRFCAVTNYREVPALDGAKSRGDIPLSFLSNKLSSIDYAQQLSSEFSNNIDSPAPYSGFNALFFDGEELVYCSNRLGDEGYQVLPPGDYGLCNHLLETPWPKVRIAKKAFTTVLSELDNQQSEAALFQIMENTDTALDSELPDTGIGLSGERLLSSIFITSSAYGTRATSLVRIHTDKAEITERSYIVSKTDVNEENIIKGDVLDYTETHFKL